MKGIKTTCLNRLVDEAPRAYKDIKKVIEYQEGILIDIVDHFRPILVIKG